MFKFGRRYFTGYDSDSSNTKENEREYAEEVGEYDENDGCEKNITIVDELLEKSLTPKTSVNNISTSDKEDCISDIKQPPKLNVEVSFENSARTKKILLPFMELEKRINMNNKKIINIINIKNIAKEDSEKKFIKYMNTLTCKLSTPYVVGACGVYFFKKFFLCFCDRECESIFSLLHSWNTKYSNYFEILKTKKLIKELLLNNINDELVYANIKKLNDMFQYNNFNVDPKPKTQIQTVSINPRFYLNGKKINKAFVNAFFEVCFTRNSINCIEECLPKKVDIGNIKLCSRSYSKLIDNCWNTEIIVTRQKLTNTRGNFGKRTKGYFKKKGVDTGRFFKFFNPNTKGTKKSAINKLRSRGTYFLNNQKKMLF